MKKKFILFVICAMFCTLGLLACSNDSDKNGQGDEVSANQLQEANSNCISIETHDVVMQSDTEGTVEITVQLPNYEKLYKEAYASENPDQYLLKALESGKYDVREYEIKAKVSIEEGQEIIHTDEAIKELLKQELANASNALMEVE